MLFTGGDVFVDGKFLKTNIRIDQGRIISLAPDLAVGEEVTDVSGYSIFPGFIDVHTHLREPGFFYKETIKSGSYSAARGGYTTVFSMPNLDPCPDTPAHLAVQRDIIDRDAVIRVIPYGTITKGEKGEELSDMEEIAEHVCAFSDDGRGVQNEEIMEEAMKKAKALGKVICAHCEDNSLLRGGYIHDGAYAASHGHRGICSESEWKQIDRDVALAEKIGCAYHVCHVSTKESVEIIRKAKKRGVDVTCETAPHYLTLDENDLKEEGRFKMNPPLRSAEDRLALIEGIKDGTIDMIATDHAPHSQEEKSKGLEKSLMGVVGLETAFPVLYTELIKKNVVSLERILEMMTTAPARRFGLKSGIAVGSQADFCAYDLKEKYVIDPDDFLSKGRSTPFAGRTVFGKNKLTVFNGKIVWQDK